MIGWKRLLRGRRAPVLPGSVPAIIFLAFFLTFLSTLTPLASPPARTREVGTLQPIGGEGDASEPQEKSSATRQSTRRAISTPKPLIIREELPETGDGESLVGEVEPVRGRCVIQIGGCRLELEFENQTNGWVSDVDIRFQLSRSGRSIRSGYINGTSDRLAPMQTRTVSQRIDDINFDSYELEFCVVLFAWFSGQADDQGNLTRSDACLNQTIQVER